MELDGSLDDPSYINNLPIEERERNQNVFPFALSAAGMEINLMLRYLLATDWWPLIRQQDYQFVTGEMQVINKDCHPNCSFRQRRAQGDAENPSYLIKEKGVKKQTTTENKWQTIWRRVIKIYDRIF